MVDFITHYNHILATAQTVFPSTGNFRIEKPSNLMIFKSSHDTKTYLSEKPRLRSLSDIDNDNSTKKLDLSSLDIEIIPLSLVSKMRNLESLDLTFNRFNNVPDGFSFGRSKNSLEYLTLCDTIFNYNLLNAITRCRKLKVLTMNRIDFGNVPSSFSFNRLENTLEFLDINNSEFNYSFLLAISRCKKLKYLDISESNLSKEDQDVRRVLSYLSERIKNFVI